MIGTHRSCDSSVFIGLLIAGVFSSLAPSPAYAQQCLGRPIDPGEQATAARVDLDRFSSLTAEYSGVTDQFAWRGFAGGAADELVPPGDFSPVFGGGVALTGIHRAVCPAVSVWTTRRDHPGDSSTRWTVASLGIALGRRLGRDRLRGAAFVHPHLRFVREDSEFGEPRSDETRQKFWAEGPDDTRHEFWVEGGFSLRGERLWGRGTLGLQVGGYSFSEDVLDGSLGFSMGMAF